MPGRPLRIEESKYWLRQIKGKNGCREVDKVFSEMTSHGVEPNAFHLAAGVKKIVGSVGVEAAADWLEEKCKSGLRPDEWTYNTLADGFAKKGKVDDVETVLKNMGDARLKPDVFTYNSLVKAHVKADDLEGAKRRFTEMERVEIRPNERTYTILADGLAAKGKVDDVEAVLKNMGEAGLKPDVVTYTSLVKADVKANDLEGAQRRFIKKKGKRVFPSMQTYHDRANEFAEKGEVNGVETVLKHMGNAGLKPNVVTYNIVAKAHVRAGDPERAREQIGRMKAAGVRPDRITYNTVANGFAKKGRSEEHNAVVEEMRNAGFEPDKFTYTSGIDACTRGGDKTGAEAWLDKMRGAKVELDVVAYGAATNLYAQVGDVWGTEECLRQMHGSGIKPNPQTCSTHINAYVKKGDPAGARACFQTLRVGNSPFDAVVYNTVARAYIFGCEEDRGESIVDALETMQKLDIMPLCNKFTYNVALAELHRSKGHTEAAMKLYHEGLSSGSLPRSFGEDGCVDLHNLTVGAAKANVAGILRDIVERLARREVGGREVHDLGKDLRFNCGEGKHSPGGIPKIKPAVMELLCREGVRCEEEWSWCLRVPKDALQKWALERANEGTHIRTENTFLMIDDEEDVPSWSPTWGRPESDSESLPMLDQRESVSERVATPDVSGPESDSESPQMFIVVAIIVVVASVVGVIVAVIVIMVSSDTSAIIESRF